MLRQFTPYRRWSWLAVLIIVSLSSPWPALAKGRNVKPKAVPAKRSKPTAKPANVKPKPPIAVAARPLLSPQLTATIVTSPSGAVVLRNGKKLVVKAGTMLQAGDVLLGAASGNLNLRIGQQGTVDVKPKSRLNIKTLLRQSKNDPDTIDNRLKLERGTIMVRLKKLKGQSRFIIDTPSATTAARGTAFIVEADDTRTTVMVESGVVGVSSVDGAEPKNNEPELQVWAWQKAIIEKSLPPKAQPMTPDDWSQMEELRLVPLPPSMRPEPVGLLKTMPGHRLTVRSVDFSSDWRTAISCADGGEKQIIVWDMMTGKEIRHIPHLEPNSGHFTVQFTPDGENVISSVSDGVSLWNLDSGQEIRHFKISYSPHVNLSRDGKFFLSIPWARDEKYCRLWSVESGQEIRRFEGHEDVVYSAAISPDGKRVLTGSKDKTLRLWDVATGKELRRYDSENEVSSVYFTPDGRRAFFHSPIGQEPNQTHFVCHLWDIENWREIRQFFGAGPVTFLPDGRRFLMVSPSNNFILYDLASGSTLCNFQMQTGIASLAISPDGTRALCGGGDGMVRLWSLPSLQPQQPFMEDYESSVVGQPAPGVSAYEAAEPQQALVTGETAASGKRCLKYNQVKESYSSSPITQYYPDFSSGVVFSRFDLKLQTGSGFLCQWHDGGRRNPITHQIDSTWGPVVEIDGNGSLSAGGKKLTQLPSNQWMRFEIVSGIGAQATGTFDLKVQVRGSDPMLFKNLACDADFKHFKVLSFGSNVRPLPQTFYLDNVQVRLQR